MASFNPASGNLRRLPHASLLALAVILLGCTLTATRLSAQPFDVGIFGDMPYVNGLPDPKPTLQAYANILADINATSLQFTVHVGDYTNGPECGDSVVNVRVAEFNSMTSPLIFIFGDNDWTDCARGGFDPLERLVKLRQVFTHTDESFGQRKLRLERQSVNPRYRSFSEHVRWSQGNVLFVGLHIVGSNNNWGNDSTPSREYVERNAATLAWIKESFAFAKERGMAGIAFFLQANPYFDRSQIPDEQKKYVAGFDDFLNVLREETIAFRKPVVAIHGDTHYFRIDKPMNNPATGSVVPNFTRAESFGSPHMHWLRMRVDPSDPNIFSFTPMIVAKNVK